ncbi:hypothetical protein HW555_011842 [Spodoptera exigua]|uniref:MICOS complex subunit MIC10 n=1 Tax=Spodoptera exigua TaxID=7107 RepID=A0A835G878_SPOEX|nr:hypothetical protein HW555_011842 [Spodoptera exigua]
MDTKKPRSISATVQLCLSDALLKAGAGTLIGTVLSMLFTQGRRFPIVMGLGMGLGFSWANCQ